MSAKQDCALLIILLFPQHEAICLTGERASAHGYETAPLKDETPADSEFKAKRDKLYGKEGTIVRQAAQQQQSAP